MVYTPKSIEVQQACIKERDYAVVVGVPARIIRYRYAPDEIAALNRIAWGDWPDEKIRKNYNDFYLDIKEFIKKYDVSI